MKKRVMAIIAVIILIAALIPLKTQASIEDFTLDYAIVAKEYKQGIGHVEGNVLIHNLWTYCSIENGRVPGEYNTSYIQNLIDGLYVFQNGTTNKLVTSDTYKIEKKGNQWFVDNKVFGCTNNLYSVVQKSDGDFLDFEVLFKDLENYSQNLYKQVNASKITEDNIWNGKFTSVEGNTVVFNINAKDLSKDIDQGEYLKTIAKDKIVIINVITDNEETIDIEAKVQNGGWDAWSGNVLWNFGSYTGIINQNCIFSGTILAPAATVNINAGNLIGSVICDTVTHGSEIHKVAFRGLKDNAETSSIETSASQKETETESIPTTPSTAATKQIETENSKTEEVTTEIEKTTVQRTTTSSTEMIKETKAPEVEADESIAETNDVKPKKTPEIAADISLVSVQTGDREVASAIAFSIIIFITGMTIAVIISYSAKRK